MNTKKIRWIPALLLLALNGGWAATPATLRTQGKEAFDRQQYAQALNAFEKIPARGKTDRDRSYQAWSHYFLYDPATALAGFREILESQPQSVDALCGTGWALHALGRKEFAKVAFRKALKLENGVKNGVKPPKSSF